MRLDLTASPRKEELISCQVEGWSGITAVIGVGGKAISVYQKISQSNIAAVPAVYHDTLRPELIQRTDLLGIYGEYSQKFC